MHCSELAECFSTKFDTEISKGMLLLMTLVMHRIELTRRQDGLKKADMDDFLGPSLRAVSTPLHVIERMVNCGNNDVQDNHD